MWGWVTDMEKVASMQAMLTDNFWKNFGHFWIDKNFLAVFPGNAQNLILLSTLNLFFVRKYPMCWGKLQFRPLLYALELFEFADISQH